MFGLLGPLLVTDEAAVIEIPAAKPRVLLATLLLHANQPVSVDQLAEAVWGDDAPASTRPALHNLVMRLRRALGPAYEDRLRAVGSGYRFSLGEGELDIHRLEDLHQRYRAARRAGDWASAADLLTSALALWRGEPLVDVPSEAHAAEAGRLTELRAQTLEWRIEADLRLGRHADVLPELRSFAADQPLREGPQGQLMLALAKSGRRAEALDVYRELRARLVAELGVEPGPDLHRLHQRILAGDTAGPTPAARIPAPPDRPRPDGETPSQLLSDLPDFTGRAPQVAELRRLLTEPTVGPGVVVVTAVTGAGGIGKTSLAVHVAHRSRNRFPDGQLYVRLRGESGRPLTPAEGLDALLRALGAAPSDGSGGVDELAAAYRGLLANRRVLILLDDADSAAQVRPLIPGSDGCRTVVTSRNRLPDLDGARHLPLDALDAADAFALFARIVGERRVAAEPAAADSILLACAGLPLAIRIAAARLLTRPTWTLRTLADRLADATRRLDELRTGDLAVRASFDVSYTTLPAPAGPLADQRRAFRMLGLWSGPDISLPAAAALLDLDLRSAEDVLESLVDAHLLESPAPERYRLHDLLRVYADERGREADAPDVRAAAVARVTAWYLHTAHGARRIVNPQMKPASMPEVPESVTPLGFDDYASALAWCERERANLVAAVHLADAHDLPAAWLLPVTLHSYFMLRTYWRDWTEVLGTGLAWARRAGDREAEAWTLGYLSTAYAKVARPEAYETSLAALTLYQELGDRHGQTVAVNNIASTLHQQGRYDDAIAWRVRALPLYREEGMVPIALVAALNNLGLSYHMTGRDAEAIDCYREALDVARASQELVASAAVLDSLGETYRDIGRTEQAVASLREAIDIRRAIGDRAGEAGSLDHLAAILLADGRPAEAREAWRCSLAIFEQLDHPTAPAVRTRLAGLNAG